MAARMLRASLAELQRSVARLQTSVTELVAVSTERFGLATAGAPASDASHANARRSRRRLRYPAAGRVTRLYDRRSRAAAAPPAGVIDMLAHVERKGGA
jgi:hypothetical protein